MFRNLHVIILFLGVLSFGLFFPSRVTAEGSNSVYISEVFYSRSSYSSFDKWIELYNPTNNSVNLQGHSLIIGKSNYTVPLSGVIAPGDYFIIQNSREGEVHMLENLGVAIDQYSGRVYWLSNKTTEDTHITLSLQINGVSTQTINYGKTRTNELLALDSTSLECSISNCFPSTYNWKGYFASPKIPLHLKESPVAEPILLPAVQKSPVSQEVVSEYVSNTPVEIPLPITAPTLSASTVNQINSISIPQTAVESNLVLSPIPTPVLDTQSITSPIRTIENIPKLQPTTFSRSIISISVPSIEYQELEYVSSNNFDASLSYSLEEFKLLLSIILASAWLKHEFSKQEVLLTNFATVLRLSTYV
jgi:Lamin Tail Domain